MTLKQFLDQYDLQVGDIVEMEGGEKYLYDPAPMLWGPLPNHTESVSLEWPSMCNSKPLRVLRPEWVNINIGPNFGRLQLEILAPKTQIVGVSRVELVEVTIDGKKYRLVEE